LLLPLVERTHIGNIITYIFGRKPKGAHDAIAAFFLALVFHFSHIPIPIFQSQRQL
jgi:membrane associated rhomboid family serine protease